MLITGILFLFTETVFSKDDSFVKVTVKAEKLICQVGKSPNEIIIEGLKKSYTANNSNSKITRITHCEKVTLANYTYYVIRYENEFQGMSSYEKSFVFEVAILDLKKQILQTTRSEIFDQINLDVDNSNLNQKVHVSYNWGINKKSYEPMIRFESTYQNEKPFVYYIQYNKKNIWFENVF